VEKDDAGLRGALDVGELFLVDGHEDGRHHKSEAEQNAGISPERRTTLEPV
jgi:hypothetical protein